MGTVPRAARAAAVLYAMLGAGFGVGGVVALAALVRDGELPMTPWGFRALAGPISDRGVVPTVVFGTALIGVCAADTVAGVGLWRGRRWAGRLGLATTLPALALGVGFALPFLLAGVPARVALVLAAWARLR